mmetsp:Transcript_43411/g.112076  ORF Transcript_43411/g.112076 Transcript_43411/m.112076 type:complete len:220 (-) Transcript_43411:996-1655(-)
MRLVRVVHSLHPRGLGIRHEIHCRVARRGLDRRRERWRILHNHPRGRLEEHGIADVAFVRRSPRRVERRATHVAGHLLLGGLATGGCCVGHLARPGRRRGGCGRLVEHEVHRLHQARDRLHAHVVHSACVRHGGRGHGANRRVEAVRGGDQVLDPCRRLRRRCKHGHRSCWRLLRRLQDHGKRRRRRCLGPGERRGERTRREHVVPRPPVRRDAACGLH